MNTPNIFINNDKFIGTKENIASMFNEFFTNIQTLLKTLQLQLVHLYLITYKTEMITACFCHQLMKKEVHKVVESCKNKSSTDADGLSMIIVKRVITTIIKPLTHVFNTSFKTGVFPDKLKIAKIILIFTAGKEENYTNYKPILLQPQFSKILEKLFSTRLSAFVDKYKVINPCQYGFRENMSTSCMP